MKIRRLIWPRDEVPQNVPITDSQDAGTEAIESSESQENEEMAAASVISFPKSGKTWLAYLYVYYSAYMILEGEADDLIDNEIGFSYQPEKTEAFNVLMKNPVSSAIPGIRFGHAFPKNGTIPYYRLDIKLGNLSAKSGIFLVRDPRDVLVSYYHHIKTARKVALADDVDMSEFLRSETLGIRALIGYMNQVAERAPEYFPNFAIYQYEDFVADAIGSFSNFLRDVGVTTPNLSAVVRAIEKASFSELQKKNRNFTVQMDLPSDENSLRFRKGRPGSFQYELSSDDQKFLSRIINRHLHPIFERYKY